MTARSLPVSVVPSPSTGRPLPEFTWPQIIHRAPKMAATMARYLDQLAVSGRPATVVAVDLTLRQFAACVAVGEINSAGVTPSPPYDGGPAFGAESKKLGAGVSNLVHDIRDCGD